jgi:hypothetical protein
MGFGVVTMTEIVVIVVVFAIVMVSGGERVLASKNADGFDETCDVTLKLVKAIVALAAAFIHVQFSIYLDLQRMLVLNRI